VPAGDEDLTGPRRQAQLGAGDGVGQHHDLAQERPIGPHGHLWTMAGLARPAPDRSSSAIAIRHA
jgi:hypothetical protein